jgi:hypothetical protein
VRRHETDLVSLAFGLAVLGVTIAALTGDGADRRWIFPVVLAAVGLVGLLAAALRARLGNRDRTEGPS